MLLSVPGMKLLVRPWLDGAVGVRRGENSARILLPGHPKGAAGPAGKQGGWGAQGTEPVVWRCLRAVPGGHWAPGYGLRELQRGLVTALYART